MLTTVFTTIRPRRRSRNTLTITSRGEGYAVINNERVRHEILSASGQDIRMASADPQTTAPLYENQYNRLTSGQATLDQVVTAIGNTYGAYEHVGDGRTYQQVFLDNYHSGGGTR